MVKRNLWSIGAVLTLTAACAGNGTATGAKPAGAAARVDVGPLVGWYGLEAGRPVLVTWAADGGLRMFAFGDRPLAARLAPAGGLAFRWFTGPTDYRTVMFDLEKGGRASGFTWSDAKGVSHHAPAMPGHSYRPRELSFGHGGTPLSGTLFVPQPASGPPVAVMIHGSGRSDRDNFWYMSIAHGLASNGIAVLLPDKRGSGKSGGHWETASLQTLAGDTAAAIEAVRREPDIGGERVGVLGISQGGHIAPMVPALAKDVAFVVNVSGAAVPFTEQLQHETRMTLRQGRWPGFLHPLIRPVAAMVARRRQSAWWALNGESDPIPYWKALQVPGLIVYGAEDEYDNVPVERSVRLLQQADETGAAAGLTIIVFKDSGHALYAPGTTRVRDDFLARLTEWIHQNSRRVG
jgi:dipeptidyl aminopeptidase/acylaminoacyl peptidase